MGIVVTGSIATDHLMVFPGRFSDALVAGQLDQVSLSFLVDDLQIRRGGIGANISLGLGRLGLRPILVGAVGRDFAEYGEWLREEGVEVDHVRVSRTRHTARFVCTTDAEQNQIASFYAGAMQEAREIDLARVVEKVGDVEMVLIGPDDPEAMLRHTGACRGAGLPFSADPSQQLASIDGDDVRTLVEGATYLFTNEYERGLLLRKTGWTADEVLHRVGAWVTTRGPEGVTVSMAGTQDVLVGVPAERRKADPTGVGDAFRAGFLAGTVWRLGEKRAAQVGCMMATLVIEWVGSQQYTFDPQSFLQRFAEAYGPTAAAEVEAAMASAPSVPST